MTISTILLPTIIRDVRVESAHANDLFTTSKRVGEPFAAPITKNKYYHQFDACHRSISDQSDRIRFCYPASICDLFLLSTRLNWTLSIK